MSKKAIMTVEGGLGKNFMMNAILPLAKEKYEEIYMLSPYYDVFKCSDLVEEAFPLGGSSNIYQDLCLDDDCDVLWREPYANNKFIKKQCHLFDAWLDELGIEKPANFNAMDLVPSVNVGKEYPQVVKDVESFVKDHKKFILVQFCGGQSPLGDVAHTQYNDRNEGIKRNFYKGQQLIDLLKKEYPDAEIIHYALENEPSYEGAIKMVKPYLFYHELAKYAFKIVCTDSSLQHLTVANCNDITVIWGETRPGHFGYNKAKNICAKNVKNSSAYFRPLGVSPSIVKFPTPEEVMEVVKMTKEEYDKNDSICKL